MGNPLGDPPSILSPVVGSLEKQVVDKLQGGTKKTVLILHPRKFNIAPEKSWLEDEFTFGIPYS